VTSQKISSKLRQKLEQATQNRCGYCQTQAIVIGMKLTVEHIIPKAVGGTSEEMNLWLSCRPCNEYKGDKTSAIDPQTGEEVPLFNPREQKWAEHFAWIENSSEIRGLTAIGRATVVALKLNHADVVRSRRRWVQVGWHPPEY
jgi:hypothetical protein